MPKKGKILAKRRQYIKARVSNRNSNITAEVNRIARDLFLSTRQVYRDLYSED